MDSSSHFSSISDLGSERDNDSTPLQKHVMFFDRNNDGIVYPSESYQGFRALGFGVIFSALSAFVIHLSLSSRTLPQGKKKRSLDLPIYVKNIKNVKHGSDSGVYDKQGRFVEEKFEEIFLKHAITHGNALTGEELSKMLKANREPKDYKGWLSSLIEWKTLYHLCKDQSGLLQKEAVKAVYDGSLFHKVEKERRSSS